MSYMELVAELQTLSNDELDARWQEAQDHDHTAHTACMENGGHVKDEFHYHSPDSKYGNACSASSETSLIIFYEYKRRSFKTPRQRERDAA